MGGARIESVALTTDSRALRVPRVLEVLEVFGDSTIAPRETSACFGHLGGLNARGLLDTLQGPQAGLSREFGVVGDGLSGHRHPPHTPVCVPEPQT